MKYLVKTSMASLVGWIAAIVVVGQTVAVAQEASEPQSAGAQIIEPGNDALSSEFVTINVKDANIAEVLKAYSLQTGQSIVVGPDVVSDNVNVRLNNIPWEEALDVILKPYGFGYRVVGDTIVISKLENIVTVEGIEPLVSKVYILSYLDAYDVKEICEAQLSGRGKISILKNKGLPGWEFGGGNAQSGSSSSQTGLGTMKREKTESIEKSKKLIITDVPSNVSRIEKVLEELDQVPTQVLIESRFIEISSGDLRDLGLDFATGNNGLSTPGVQVANPGKADQWGVEKNDSLGLTPAAFDPLTDTLSASLPYNSGLQLLYSRIGGSEFELLIHALEENGDVNVLSAPRILTQNNQEAAILVGEKFPIIESQNNSAGTGNGTTSTSLKYYENIGIQMNVIPQVCADNYINMIVHPVVSSIDGFESGVVSTGGDEGSLTRYPRLKVREAQTQILLQSEDTVAIGGLQNEVEQDSVYGIPFLKDIPFLGRLFRRETTSTKKIDLLILIKASVVDNKPYAAQSLQLQQKKLEIMGMELEQENLDAVEPMEEVDPAAVPSNEEIAEVEAMVAVDTAVAKPVGAEAATDEAVENEEILNLVRSMEEPVSN
jgi:type IV pilus assembly protein PilQ